MKNLNLNYSLFTMYLYELLEAERPDLINDTEFFFLSDMYEIFLPHGSNKDRWEPTYKFYSKYIDESNPKRKGTKS